MIKNTEKTLVSFVSFTITKYRDVLTGVNGGSGSDEGAAKLAFSVMAALMAATVLAGCQPQSEDSATQTQTNATATEQAAVEQTAHDTEANVSAAALAESEKTTLSDTTLQEVFTTYRDPNCGCCHEWVAHANGYGIQLKDEVLADAAAVSVIKDEAGVPSQMRSCHTTVTESGYVFEGHVPMKYVDEFLQNPPANAIGLSAPGMPVGSPGMEVGDKFMPYALMLLKDDGSVEEYAMVTEQAAQY